MISKNTNSIFFGLLVFYFAAHFQLSDAIKDVLFNEICPKTELEFMFDSMADNQKLVYLSTGKSSAALIHQIWTQDDTKRFHQCKIQVSSYLHSPEMSKHNRGVFLSVRKINLRRNPNNNECIDYIKISFEHSKIPKICGVFNVNQDIGFYNDDSGNATIRIHIDRGTPFSANQSFLEVELLFTAYENCDNMNSTEKFSCNPKDNRFCINKILENDNYINCPPPYCTDEKKCKDSGIDSASTIQLNSFILFSAFFILYDYLFIIRS